MIRYWLAVQLARRSSCCSEIITEPTPRSTAAWNGGRWIGAQLGLAELGVALVVPPVVPPSPT